MPPRGSRTALLQHLLLSLSLSLIAPAQAQPSRLVLNTRDPDAPLPGGPDKEQDLTFLPAQIGGIVGAYAVSLVLVALTLLALSKKRRQHLSAGNEEVEFEARLRKDLASPDFPPAAIAALSILTPSNPAFPCYSPSKSDFSGGGLNPYVSPSPTSATTVGAPGVDRHVDQRVVAADRLVAQSQLEDMFKHVLEHEDAKKRGVVYEVPVMTNGSVHSLPQSHPQSPTAASFKSNGTVLSKKERSRPAGLNLDATREEKTQSRTSSLLSALRSPKKKAMKGVNISSPIMTPKSATFPRQESQELNPIPHRHYAPAVPPPVPTDQIPYAGAHKAQAPLTPDISPESVQSIDERIGSQLPPLGHARTTSLAPTEGDPQSAVSEHSQAPLVGLPASPRAGSFAPSLPSSPKPGATFQRTKAPTAVRTGGSLPLRAYEPAVTSPTTIAHTTKQTVFERKGPLSPSGAMTPFTAGAVPYSPYQPFTPCMPVTPSLVTKEDRKKMRRMVPKTPTMDMVRSDDDVW